jgi:CheY-like chemotaxis protein
MFERDKLKPMWADEPSRSEAQSRNCLRHDKSGSVAVKRMAMDNVLIVDDDPIYIEVARALLNSTGAKQVSSASDGNTAKTLLVDDAPFDLILLDLNMPDFDGVEFLEHLRQMNFRGSIVIVSSAKKSVCIAVTGLGKAYGLKVVGVIEKPLTILNLVPALADA